MRRLAAIEWLARALAVLGGLVLVAITLLTVVSITGRAFVRQGLGPIPGDFELVEVLSAITVFCFLPWCQIVGGNVLVDFFTMKAGPRVNHALEALGDLVYLAIGALLTWRLWHGAVDFHAYGEQTMVLRIPIWWSFVIAMPAMALLIVTTLFTLLGHVRKATA